MSFYWSGIPIRQAFIQLQILAVKKMNKNKYESEILLILHIGIEHALTIAKYQCS